MKRYFVFFFLFICCAHTEGYIYISNDNTMIGWSIRNMLQSQINNREVIKYMRLASNL